MSTKAMNRVWESGLPRDEKYILLCLADFGDDFGESIYPSIGYLIWKTGYSETGLKKILRKLRNKKYISVGFEASKYGTNQYCINLESLPKRQPYKPPPPQGGVKSDPQGGVFSPQGGVKSDPNSLVKPLVKPLTSEKNNGDGMRTVEQIKEDTAKSCDKSMSNQTYLIGDVDTSKYPEDVRPIIDECHKLWGISPPTFRGRSNKNSRAAYWITSSRDLKEACAEFGLTALREYRKEFEDYMRTHRGLAPHTVSSPASLVNPVCGMAGKLRLKSSEVSQDKSLPSAVYEIKGSVVSFDGRRFYNGKEILDG